jgi:transcriptional regulator of acetoin/glycerol metabolism
LPTPVVNVVERVVERVIIQQDSQCLENLQEATKLITATAARLEESAHQMPPVTLNSLPEVETFPTLDEMERAMILAAYRKSNRKSVEAARLLGIGKTTFYRKLREMRQLAA